MLSLQCALRTEPIVLELIQRHLKCLSCHILFPLLLIFESVNGLRGHTRSTATDHLIELTRTFSRHNVLANFVP